MTNEQKINKLINILKNEIGYLEKKTNSFLYDKTKNAGSNNYTKYWAEIDPSLQGEPWCACFMSWGFKEAFGKDTAKKMLKHWPFISCQKISTLFTKNPNPKVGDIVIFYKNNRFAHTGLVTYVKGDYFETIEGNTSSGSTIIENGGQVAKKSYYNSKLQGTKFISPDYNLYNEINFNDILGHYAENHINKLYDFGLINGYDNTKLFKPDNYITRAEYVTIISKIITNFLKINVKEKNNFNLLDVASHWAFYNIKKCYDCGIINGDDNNNFRPNDYITRADASIIAQNLLSYVGLPFKLGVGFNDIQGHYAEKHIISLKQYGIINGIENNNFYPNENITRGQAAIILANCLNVF